MDKFLQQISNSVGAQLHGMNSTIVKVKEEDDRYKQISERIMNIHDEKYEKKEVTNPGKYKETRIKVPSFLAECPFLVCGDQ